VERYRALADELVARCCVPPQCQCRAPDRDARDCAFPAVALPIG
jgi:hypothetical protein